MPRFTGSSSPTRPSFPKWQPWKTRSDRKNLTPTLSGAVRMDKPFNFMSTHATLYRQLKSNPALVPKMAALENEIRSEEPDTNLIRGGQDGQAIQLHEHACHALPAAQVQPGPRSQNGSPGKRDPIGRT